MALRAWWSRSSCPSRRHESVFVEINHKGPIAFNHQHRLASSEVPGVDAVPNVNAVKREEAFKRAFDASNGLSPFGVHNCSEVVSSEIKLVRIWG